jgi:deoxyribonuclease-2
MRLEALVIFIVPLLAGVSAGIQCIDEEGSPVDWYVVYKLPRVYLSNRPLVYDGVAYLYLDSNNNTFRLSPNSINSTQGAVYRTLQQVYNPPTSGDFGYAFYSDQWPNGSWSSSYGHTKGAFGFDMSTGFWLLVNTPKFPNYWNLGFSYPSSGCKYGQQMMCISTALDNFDTLGSYFQYTNPWWMPDSVNVSSSVFSETLPALVDAVAGTVVSQPPWSTQFSVQSLAGVEFTLFGKYKAAGFDMVAAQVAPGVRSDVMSETWQNGAGNLLPNCTGEFWTWMVTKLDFVQADLYFYNDQDHSKWASSNGGSYMCIGDMNREESQETRSGGYVCWDNEAVNTQYNDAIQLYDSCK